MHVIWLDLLFSFRKATNLGEGKTLDVFFFLLSAYTKSVAASKQSFYTINKSAGMVILQFIFLIEFDDQTTFLRHLTLHLFDTSSISQRLKTRSCLSAKYWNIQSENTSILDKEKTNFKSNFFQAHNINISMLF